jgi:hypothetical protein
MFIRSLAATLMAGIVFTQAASAATVQNGSYSGSQANSAGINMTVTTDTTTGKPEITGFGLTITGNCKPSGTGNLGWGFNPGTDFVGDKARFVFGDDNLYVSVSLAVSGDTVTGTVTSAMPIFAPYTKAPKSALFCSVPAQSFTMTYQGTASVAPSAPHVLVVR